MVCNNCRYHSPDGLNFCPNCGIQFNPQAFRPYQAPQSNFNAPVETNDRAQKSIFTLGIIAFSVNFIWILIGFLMHFMGYEYYGSFSIIFKTLTLVTAVATVFFSFIFVKKQGYKTTLLILFIVLLLFELYQVFFRGFFGAIY